MPFAETRHRIKKEERLRHNICEKLSNALVFASTSKGSTIN